MSTFDPIPEKLEGYARQVIDAAVEIHLNLGPGLLESVYEAAMAIELTSGPFLSKAKSGSRSLTNLGPLEGDCD